MLAFSMNASDRIPYKGTRSEMGRRAASDAAHTVVTYTIPQSKSSYSVLSVRWRFLFRDLLLIGSARKPGKSPAPSLFFS